jgi:hypothetical protein
MIEKRNKTDRNSKIIITMVFIALILVLLVTCSPKRDRYENCPCYSNCMANIDYNWSHTKVS